jgi:8-oxo-dGTP pyrophosphatase MutT (NUDIX family)
MAEILVPRPAATVMTLREGPNGYEILMLRRNLNSDFVGGAFVFPGGGVDPEDAGAAAQRLAVGITDEQASTRLGLESGGLAYYVACLRELFEEAGLLVACDSQGRSVTLDDPETLMRLSQHRRAVNDRQLGFVEMMEREDLFLDLRELEYMAHWVTPIGPPRRFDTRFFVALAPVGQVATHDEGETVADQWLRPLDALATHHSGQLEMILPTIRNLQSIAGFDSAREVIAFARSLTDIECVRPRMIERDGSVVIVLPGDVGYDD